MAGSQLDEEPRPCHFCLLKILYMAQVVQFPFCLFVEVNCVELGGICAYCDCGGRPKDC